MTRRRGWGKPVVAYESEARCAWRRARQWGAHRFTGRDGAIFEDYPMTLHVNQWEGRRILGRLR